GELDCAANTEKSFCRSPPWHSGHAAGVLSRVGCSKWCPQPRHSYSKRGIGCILLLRIADCGMRITEHGAVMRIVTGALAFRLLSAILALLVNVTLPPAQPPQTTMFGAPSPFWDPFTRYDSGWYYQIARNGYGFV